MCWSSWRTVTARHAAGRSKKPDLDQWTKGPARGRGDRLVRNPEFHRHNVYALVMKTLSRFEFALGRRIEWGFDGHQLKVAPHAFSEANAFYSDQLNGLLFGYFPGTGGETIFTCLSHDVIVHETTHALVDGLRERFREPSSADQAAFHDTRYNLRESVLDAFRSYGIDPASPAEGGYWQPAPEGLDYSRTHFDAMRRDRDEVFHFVWENRRLLGLNEEAFTRVESLRPCMRVGSDGFVLHETVCEYVQILEPLGSELAAFGLEKPLGMPDDRKLRLFGGGALIFDEVRHSHAACDCAHRTGAARFQPSIVNDACG